MSLNFAVLGIWGARCGLGLGHAGKGHGIIIVCRGGMRDTGLGIGFRGIWVRVKTFFSFFAIFDDVGLSGREISVPRLQTVSGVTDFVDLQSSEIRRNRLSISPSLGVRVYFS